MGSQRLLALCSSIVIATRLKATYASSRESDRDFVIMLVYDAASDGKIRACEHGSRAGQRASDRLTLNAADNELFLSRRHEFL